MIYCKNCGNQMPDGTAFCPKCGTKAGADKPMTVPAAMANGKKIKKKKPIYKRWWFWVIIVIVVIGLIPNGGDTDDAGTETGGDTVQTEPEVEYLSVSVSELHEALEANALNASDTYKGKHVEITGLVKVIDSSGKYISIYPEGDDWTILGVQCYIKNNDQKEYVKTLSQGESVVTIRGKITSVGEVLGYSLDIEEFVK